jgi:hypothetical protein
MTHVGVDISLSLAAPRAEYCWFAAECRWLRCTGTDFQKSSDLDLDAAADA